MNVTNITTLLTLAVSYTNDICPNIFLVVPLVLQCVYENQLYIVIFCKRFIDMFWVLTVYHIKIKNEMAVNLKHSYILIAALYPSIITAKSAMLTYKHLTHVIMVIFV